MLVYHVLNYVIKHRVPLNEASCWSLILAEDKPYTYAWQYNALSWRLHDANVICLTGQALQTEWWIRLILRKASAHACMASHSIVSEKKLFWSISSNLHKKTRLLNTLCTGYEYFKDSSFIQIYCVLIWL